MIEYVRAALLLRLKMRKKAMEYSQEFEKKFAALEQRRVIERLLRTPRKAA